MIPATKSDVKRWTRPIVESDGKIERVASQLVDLVRFWERPFALNPITHIRKGNFLPTEEHGDSLCGDRGRVTGINRVTTDEVKIHNGICEDCVKKFIGDKSFKIRIGLKVPEVVARLIDEGVKPEAIVNKLETETTA